MNARELNEAQLADALPQFLHALGLTLLGTEVCLGAFRFDAVARDSDGTVVVIELKAAASQTTLHQLLIYPHVLARCLVEGDLADRAVRSLLITTHLDSNVVDVAKRLAPVAGISIKVCVGDTDSGLKLVDPSEAGSQIWDQAKAGRRREISITNGKLVVKGSIDESSALTETAAP